MRENNMLKIGEFARIGQVSIVTLRHYDQCGLLKPSALDPNTGYRYYSLDQLSRLHRIVALKDLGFPLEQIAQLLEDDLSLEQLKGMFKLKQAQIQQSIDLEQARLRHIAARLRQIEQEGTMSVYDVRLKQVEPLLVATVRKLFSPEDDLRQPYETISAYLDQQGIEHAQYPQSDMQLWHSRYELHDEGIYADIEIAVPLSTSLPDNEQITVRTLPGGLMACIVHTGHPLSLGPAWMTLRRWIQDNEYRYAGPPRYLHLQHTEHLEPGQYVTEVQVPVEKQNA
jgi:DNA-binding transcriptional MerR regulator